MNSKIKVKCPIGIQWKIAEARLQEMKNSIGGCLESDPFYIPETDVKYAILIYPNGHKEENRGKTCIYFDLEFKEKKEIDAEFTVSIDSANYYDEGKYVYKKSIGWGGGICTTADLFDPEKRFILDGEMVIKIEGFFMLEKEAPVKLCNLGENGNSLTMDLWNQTNKDFTIVADGQNITAHKLVLSTRSPVFAAMFQPHTLEAQENKVVIPDFPFGIVETAIKLCYDTRLVENIPIDDQIFLLQFFDKYDIQSLKADLENYMISEVDESNVCHLANSAIISNASKLQKKCGELLQQCYRANQLVNDLDSLDKDFAFAILKNSLFKISF